MTAKIITIKVGAEEENCYLVALQGGEAFVVDPGDDAKNILAEIKKIKNLRLKYILLTHGHYDHVRAVDEIKIAYPKASVVLGEEDVMLYRNAPNQGLYVHQMIHKLKSEIVTYSDGTQIPFGDDSIKIIGTPGHTPGGQCYLFGNVLFSGDTLFYRTVGRTDLPFSSEPDLYQSLKKLCQLTHDTKIYPGHGRPSILADEKSQNPFLLEIL